MDAHPGSELSIPQLLNALEGKLNRLVQPAARYALFSSTERQVLNTSFLQICVQPKRLPFERGRGTASPLALKS